MDGAHRLQDAVLAVMLGCLAPLVPAPLAAAAPAPASGSISGTVQQAGTPVEGGYVYVYSPSGETVASTVTGAQGKYEAKGLAAGSYVVEFFPKYEVAPPQQSAFAPQYYKEANSLATATPVAVAAASATSEVDGNLREGGKISGAVTGEDGEALAGVTVYALGPAGEQLGGYSETGANGGYTIEGLLEGAYKLEFYPGEALDFVPQYYADAPTLASATAVAVKEAGAVTAASATLAVGGEIAGRVTDSVTHEPLAHVRVRANSALGDEFFGGEAQTNANGEYTVRGLSSGSYDLSFKYKDASVYIAQSDEGVAVTKGRTTAGVDVELVPKAPNDTSAPLASGTAAPGQTLSCSPGSWSGISTILFTYRWLRDGSAIEGATGNAYTVQPADQGHGLSCEVTATNAAGRSSATSNALNVPAPAPPPSSRAPVAAIALAATKLIVSASAARVPISCGPALPCAGTIELLQQRRVKRRRRHRTITRLLTSVLGETSFALAPGHSGVFVVRLSKAGLHALDATRHRRLSILVELSVHGAASVKRTALLVQSAVKRR